MLKHDLLLRSNGRTSKMVESNKRKSTRIELIEQNIHGIKVNFHKYVIHFFRKHPIYLLHIFTCLLFSIVFVTIETKFKSISNFQKLFITNNNNNTFIHAFDLCIIKYNFIEDYLFVLFAFPLTALLYVRNAISQDVHSPQCSFVKNFQKTVAKTKWSKVKLFFLSIFCCSCRFVLPVPMNPFSKKNRLISKFD